LEEAEILGDEPLSFPTPETPEIDNTYSIANLKVCVTSTACKVITAILVVAAVTTTIAVLIGEVIIQ